MMAVSESAFFALRWIDSQPCGKSEWRRGAKAAYGPPEKWDAMKLSGRAGSIVISASDWKIVCEYLRPAVMADLNSDRMFFLSEKGKAAIREAA
jgi:hypothetical protein